MTYIRRSMGRITPDQRSPLTHSPERTLLPLLPPVALSQHTFVKSRSSLTLAPLAIFPLNAPTLRRYIPHHLILLRELARHASTPLEWAQSSSRSHTDIR